MTSSPVRSAILTMTAESLMNTLKQEEINGSGVGVEPLLFEIKRFFLSLHFHNHTPDGEPLKPTLRAPTPCDHQEAAAVRAKRPLRQPHPPIADPITETS